MQYYRLWIYSCNVVLGLTSAIFIIFAAFVVADVRLSLLEGVELYHPTFFYAYGALILQCGVVQTIGCLGAKRLSHKLLSLYWSLLLLLTLGDIGVGLYWVFHLEKVKINLRPYLNKEFMQKYSKDETFTLKWNEIQTQNLCCGVDGPLDFIHHSKQAAFSSNSHVFEFELKESGLLSLPESCCSVFNVPPAVSSSSSSGTNLDKTYRVSNYSPEEEHPPFNGYPSADSSTSSIYRNDELRYHTSSSDSAGSGRRSRTAENSRLKSGSGLLEGEEDGDGDDDEDEEQGEFYVESTEEDLSSQDNPSEKEKSLEQLVVVPESRKASEHYTRWNATVQNRDIKTYEPIHAHKIRHELHRKSQPPTSSQQTDLKLINISSSLVVEENARNESNLSPSEEVNAIRENVFINKSSFRGEESRDNHNEDPFAIEPGIQQIDDLTEVEGEENQEEIFVPYDEENLHNSHKKTNKLFPSISYRVRKRKRRETRRALSVATQVPAVKKTPFQKKRIVCHEQPKGLNHHNSYRKYLLDQRKAREDKQQNRANALPLNRKKLSADWLYWITGITSKPTSVTDNSISSSNNNINKVGFAPPSSEQAEFTSGGITEEIRANEIGNLTTKTKKWNNNLVAKRKSQKLMTNSSSSFSSSLHSPFLQNHPSSNKEGITTAAAAANFKEIRSKSRQTRSVKTSSSRKKRSNSDSLKISQISAFTTTTENDDDDGDRAVSRRQVISTETNSDNNFAGSSHFSRFPSLSSISHSEAHFSHSAAAAVVSASTLANEEENNSGNNVGNGTTDDEIQKTLYVHGVGCGVKLTEWVDHVSGILFILGFCIIGFAKTCFLVILRTEIREMIEKIHMIEPEEAMSPSRAPKDPKFHHVSHPLLQNPHRSSTVSAHGSLLPTIKSPDGPSTSFITAGMIGGIGGLGGYNQQRPNRHYLRRASNIVGGDRSRSHSNETVNMTLLMATSASNNETGGREKLRSNPNLSSTGGSSGTIANLEERDPVSGLSITVPSGGGSNPGSGYAPVGAARYLRRSSTCSSSTNPYGYPYGCGFDGEPRAGPSSRFYQYFEPIYQTPHLYQQHHHHHYARNRSHSRNMSCGAILPLASYRANSIVSAVAAHRTARNLPGNATTTASNNGSGYGFLNATSKEENELVIAVSLEHIASSDQDEEVEEETDQAKAATTVSATLLETEEEEKKEQEKKDWAAATSSLLDPLNADLDKSSSKIEESIGTKLQTFTHAEATNETIGSGGGEASSDRELQRRNGNNNLDLATSLPMSYIGTPV